MRYIYTRSCRTFLKSANRTLRWPISHLPILVVSCHTGTISWCATLNSVHWWPQPHSGKSNSQSLTIMHSAHPIKWSFICQPRSWSTAMIRGFAVSNKMPRVPAVLIADHWLQQVLYLKYLHVKNMPWHNIYPCYSYIFTLIVTFWLSLSWTQDIIDELMVMIFTHIAPYYRCLISANGYVKRQTI